MEAPIKQYHLGSRNFNQLTEQEKAIATSKNWTLN